MNEVLGTALLVMVVGMLTVFAILSFVVLSGKLLIRVINSITPEEEPNKSIAPQHIAVISSVVQNLTQRKATHIKIDKK